MGHAVHAFVNQELEGIRFSQQFMLVAYVNPIYQ